MNMKRTACIALEMFESAVLRALLEAKQSGAPSSDPITSAKNISKKIGIPPSKKGRYNLIRHVLLHLKDKKYVAHPARGSWQITDAGESFLDTDF